MELHDYQIVARDFLRGRDRAALWLDLGLGKTAASLAALEPRHLPAVVVAPKRVAEAVWPAERLLWRPDLTLSLAAGEPKARALALASDADLIVLGRDNLKDALGMTKFRTVIIDELSGFKSWGSVRWKTMRKVVRDVPHVWGLTGTPSPNGYMDLWAQIALLDNGHRLGKNITAYRSRYFFPGRQIANGTIVEWLLREESEDHIKALLTDICVSMDTDGRIKLPPVTYNTLTVELPGDVRKAYRRIAEDLVVDLRDIFDGEVHSAANAAILTSKLSQICAGFLYVDDADVRDGQHTEMHQEKMKAVVEVVDGTGSPVLVFYRYQAERDMLRRALPTARLLDHPKVIEEWNAGRVPVLLAHPASAGHGLNLQHGGHTVVWTTLPWSLEEWEQGNGRLIRQGQQHPVVVHSILAARTIDHLIQARLETKAHVQNSLLAALESPV